ncbi:hypothetical protein RUM43_009175 [Polyplax serrata]|uniref:Uncharacterized protein n=1 Tax=Polyplax serrata TaxID=468196 RepID=A0AAN8PAE7_POLSC
MGYWPCDDDDDDDDDPREKSNQRAEGSEGLEKVKLVQVFSNKNRFEQVERENLQRGFHLVGSLTLCRIPKFQKDVLRKRFHEIHNKKIPPKRTRDNLGENGQKA